jgi:hypothetical protein
MIRAKLLHAGRVVYAQVEVSLYVLPSGVGRTPWSGSFVVPPGKMPPHAGAVYRLEVPEDGRCGDILIRQESFGSHHLPTVYFDGSSPLR